MHPGIRYRGFQAASAQDAHPKIDNARNNEPDPATISSEDGARGQNCVSRTARTCETAWPPLRRLEHDDGEKISGGTVDNATELAFHP